MLILAAIVAALAACIPPAHPRGQVTLGASAWATANAAYDSAMARGAETGLCVASDGFAWGWAQDGRLWARVERFALGGPQAATIRDADFTHLWWRRTICGDSLPSWHAHIAGLGGPSPCDSQSLARRPRVPFALVQVARDSIVLYYIQPGEHWKLAQDSTNYCD